MTRPLHPSFVMTPRLPSKRRVIRTLAALLDPLEESMVTHRVGHPPCRSPTVSVTHRVLDRVLDDK